MGATLLQNRRLPGGLSIERGRPSLMILYVSRADTPPCRTFKEANVGRMKHLMHRGASIA